MADGVLLDTSILIPLYNEGRFRDKVLELGVVKQLFFSIVTINEFVRGAHDAVSKNIVASFLDITRQSLMTPTEEQWIECGYVSERLLKRQKKSKEKVVLLQNDILIALGARDRGAMLITSDRKDFEVIREFIGVEIDFW